MTEQHSFNERLAAIARALLHEPDVQATLKGTVADAARTLDGAVYASVSLVLQRRQVETPVSSDDRALLADQPQYELGVGPCLDAVWHQDTFHIYDLTAEPRYADRGRRVVVGTGQMSRVRTALSAMPLAARMP